jgi:translation initiation factor IF-3
VPEVRLIDEQSEQRGVMKIDDALRYAQERDLDLVEVAPEARPPVVRVLDYSKYKYEQAQKQKQARKHQQQITIREIKLRPKIAQHDYETKKGHVERFLRHKDKVKITIMFRGREVTHPERGIQLLDRIADELAEYGVVEQRPLHEGRNMTMMLGPSKAVLSGHFDKGANGSGNGAATDEALVDAAAEPISGNGASPTEDVAAAPEPIAEPAASVPEPVVQPAASVPEPVVEPAASVPEPVVEPAASVPEPIAEPAASVPEPVVEAAPEAKPKKTPARAASTSAKATSAKATSAKATSAKATSAKAASAKATKPAAKPRSTASKTKPSSDS